jgi:3-methyladenine DNA glycosylase AlkD
MTKSDQEKNTTLLSANQFLNRLEYLRALQGASKTDKEKSVPMGQVFALAKEFMGMPLDEIEKLLESPIHEGRVGAVSIMDFEARSKKTPASRQKELFDLYIRRHDLINTWDLVDRSAPYVVGGYLFDKSREILYELARSKNMAERRTAIVSTYFFIRQNDLEDTFKIAEILVNDKDELIQMAVGGWIREAGKKDIQKLLGFLDQYAATMPRVTLRYAIEHLDKEKKAFYMNMAKEKVN